MTPAKQKLVLASASKGRLGLLMDAGLAPDVIAPADIDESQKAGEAPLDFVLRLAQEKAAKIAREHDDSFVIAADTVALLGNKIIGKAASAKEAKEILSSFSGQKHEVISGLCIIAPGGRELSKVVSTSVTFKKLTEDELDEYIKTGQWQGKSGCYGIQSKAGGFVEKLEGSLSNVVGLPMDEAKAMLHELGFKQL